uniref:Uncharacterized protein n=1 Tax=Oryza sativa subsp. japonica TaxID=39947 RepID=Q6H636_ORYSJ|nr:hypothetical protein [Oryza sativa Japonica Group]BAD25813.1 hypothetical protein [Oryza sativa Japonica Group]
MVASRSAESAKTPSSALGVSVSDLSSSTRPSRERRADAWPFTGRGRGLASEHATTRGGVAGLLPKLPLVEIGKAATAVWPALFLVANVGRRWTSVRGGTGWRFGNFAMRPTVKFGDSKFPPVGRQRVGLY